MTVSSHGSPASTLYSSVGKVGGALLLIVVSLWWMYGPIWAHYFEHADHAYRFNGDFRSFGTIVLRLVDPGLFPGSYDVDYVQWLSPIGYQKIFALGVQWLDPVAFGKVLGVILFFVGLFAMGLASYRLSGWAGAWVSMALVLFHGPEMSGMPRIFSVPILTFAVAALLYGRVFGLAILILIAATLYPPVAVISSAMLFLWLFVWPKSDRGDARAWSFNKRAVFLVMTAVLCILVEGKQWLGTQEYGPLLTARYCNDYPESQGRLGEASPCQELPPLTETLKHLSVQALSDQRKGSAWIYPLRVLAKWHLAKMGIARDVLLTGLLVLFILIMYGLHLIHDPVGRRLLIVLVAGLLGYFIAQPFAPQFYYPLRYLEKTLPIFLMIGLPASVASLATLAGTRWGIGLFRHPLSRPFSVVLAGGLVLILLGGQGRPYGGVDKDLTPFAPLMNHVRTLPKNALIAGWPKGVTESVPLLSSRSVFVSQEMHWPLHQKYTDVMRARTYALMDAYFATTVEPLIRLREQYGVTHLLLEPKLLDQGKLRYFAPFVEYAIQKRAAGRAQGFELLRQIPHAHVFTMQDLVLLDLSRLVVETRAVKGS